MVNRGYGLIGRMKNVVCDVWALFSFYTLNGWRKAGWVLRYYELYLGHANSVRLQMAVDQDACELPWYTYPAIGYLDQLDVSGQVVFEYGCGNGTLYWARRGATVWAVEDDKQWYDMVISKAQANLKIIFAEDREAYIAAIACAKVNFDIIVIDGNYRESCVATALKFLKPTGFVILDNSDTLPMAVALLRNANFIQIDFEGMGPINYYPWCTSLFLSRDVMMKYKHQRISVRAGRQAEQTILEHGKMCS
jgi:hypothetical protein